MQPEVQSERILQKVESKIKSHKPHAYLSHHLWVSGSEQCRTFVNQSTVEQLKASSCPVWWNRSAVPSNCFNRLSRALCLLVLRWGPQLCFLEQSCLLFQLVLFPQCQALEIDHCHPEHLIKLVRGQVSLGGHVEADHMSTLYGYIILVMKANLLNTHFSKKKKRILQQVSLRLFWNKGLKGNVLC